MRIYVDGEGEELQGWTTVSDTEMVIRVLETGIVEKLSLSTTAGPRFESTVQILNSIENAIQCGFVPPREVILRGGQDDHTQTVVDQLERMHRVSPHVVPSECPDCGGQIMEDIDGLCWSVECDSCTFGAATTDPHTPVFESFAITVVDSPDAELRTAAKVGILLGVSARVVLRRLRSNVPIATEVEGGIVQQLVLSLCGLGLRVQLTPPFVWRIPQVQKVVVVST